MSFVQFACTFGLQLLHPIADGRWHAVRTDDKPKKRNGRYVWDGAGGAVRNMATMDNYAIFRDSHACGTIDRDAIRQAASIARKRKEERDAAAAKQANALLVASKMVRPVAPRPYSGETGIPGHPYLVRKGFPLAVYFDFNGTLIVPMRVGHELVNVQKIDADGQKLFLSGPTKNAVCRLGNHHARQCWLVEGYATALTVREALRIARLDASVVCCFSAGNLKSVASLMGTHVYADNDKSGTGQSAAQATGLPWVMPPEVGMDANDLMVAQGISAVGRTIRELMLR